MLGPELYLSLRTFAAVMLHFEPQQLAPGAQQCIQEHWELGSVLMVSDSRRRFVGASHLAQCTCCMLTCVI